MLTLLQKHCTVCGFDYAVEVDIPDGHEISGNLYEDVATPILHQHVSGHNVSLIPDQLPAIKAAALVDIKARRDAILRQYSERLVIYQPNYNAAHAVSDGEGDTVHMPNGQTASQFASDAATAMGKTTTEWADYILGEWQTLGTGVAALEKRYLELTYHPELGINAMTSEVGINAARAAFVAL